MIEYKILTYMYHTLLPVLLTYTLVKYKYGPYPNGRTLLDEILYIINIILLAMCLFVTPLFPVDLFGLFDGNNHF